MSGVLQFQLTWAITIGKGCMAIIVNRLRLIESSLLMILRKTNTIYAIIRLVSVMLLYIKLKSVNWFVSQNPNTLLMP